MSADLQYRIATANHASGIFAVLEEVAAEVSVLLDGAERRSRVLEHVRASSGSGESWVAVDGRKVIGFLQAEPDQLERFHHDNGALHLSYGGVRAKYRGCGVFRSLTEKLVERRVPLTATVKHANKSGMARVLIKLGFVKTAATNDQDDLRRNP
jgi:ribosomal protein S18 acetylase RimI-like enzyme